MATPLYNNNTDPIIIPDNLLFYHIPTYEGVARGRLGEDTEMIAGCGGLGRITQPVSQPPLFQPEMDIEATETGVFSWLGCCCSVTLPEFCGLSELRLYPRLKLKDSCPPFLKVQEQRLDSISPREFLLRKIYVLSYSSYSRWPPLHNSLMQRQPVDLHEETKTAHVCLRTASTGQIAGIQVLPLLELAQMFGLQNW